MGRLTPGQLFEVAFWTAFGIGAYALTYKFNQEIEIYKFGAYGWPRAVILVILVTAWCQLIHDLRFHRSTDPGEAVELKAAPQAAKAAEDQEVRLEEIRHDRDYYTRMGITLALPLIYAGLLDSIGFYVLTPFFIAAFLIVAGERRWGRIVTVSLAVHVALMIVFTRYLYVGLPTGNVRPFYDISNWLVVLVRYDFSNWFHAFAG